MIFIYSPTAAGGWAHPATWVSKKDLPSGDCYTDPKRFKKIGYPYSRGYNHDKIENGWGPASDRFRFYLFCAWDKE